MRLSPFACFALLTIMAAPPVLAADPVLDENAAAIVRSQSNVPRVATPKERSERRQHIFEQRDANQQKRIEQGIESGELTEKEAERLQRGADRIERAEDRAEADGHVGKVEQRHIRRMQNRESRKIRRNKHDRQHQ